MSLPAATIVRPEGSLIASVAILPAKLGDDAGISLRTLRYGDSMKPYALVLAYEAIELNSPMLGPSGVSIGQILP
ncbi:MAG: Uncharacterised protein [Chloroflexota bacterium]|nr:MAG: Uncharacterised protein [Chloroflexota bacterium]